MANLSYNFLAVVGDNMANAYNKSILIVDNDRQFANSLSKTLTKEGYNIKTIPEELVENKLSREKKFELVLLDINTPGKWGLTTLRNIRTYFPNSRVIVLTASNDVELFNCAGEENVYAILSKPVKREKVLQCARKAIN